MDPSLVDSPVDADKVPTLSNISRTLTWLPMLVKWLQVINNFSQEILLIHGFAEQGLALSTGYITICGDNCRTTQMGVCINDQ
jgi:hypothetical protein